MSGNFYANIEVSGGVALNGDNYGTITHSTVELNSATVNLEGLVRNLRQLNQQCSELSSCFLGRESPVSPAKDLVYDIDELEYLTETLQAYLGECNLPSFQGWQRPMLELDNMSCSYQKILTQTRDVIQQSRESMEQDIIHAMGMRAEMRRLRMKLRTAIGVVAFCSNQDERDPRLQEINAVYESIRDIQERLENERALNLQPAQPFTITDLAKIQGGGSLIMGRFMAQSLSLDRKSLRDTSMRVSALIGSDLGSTRTASFLTPNEDQLLPLHGQRPSLGNHGLQEQEKPWINRNSNRSRERLNAFRDFYRDRIKYFRSAPAAALATVEENMQPLPDKRQEARPEQTTREISGFLSPKVPPKQQMQCDLCRVAIKLEQLYYTCNTCNDGGRLYCKKCANKGRTCRHELVERTRNYTHDILNQPSTRKAPSATQEMKSTAPSRTSKIPTTDQNHIASGKSDQLPFFKDYYSEDDVHPGDLVSVLWAYAPRESDEFELKRGDMLKVVGIWDDGWCTGVRHSTRADDWNAASPSAKIEKPFSEIKAFPLVCVCLPPVWQKAIEGEDQEQKVTAEAKANG